MSAGLALRDEAFCHLDLADTNDENSLLREAIVKLGQIRDTFSANDLPQFVRDRTNPDRRGRMFALLLSTDVIEEVGMVRSSNPKAHGKRVLTYRLRKATS